MNASQVECDKGSRIDCIGDDFISVLRVNYVKLFFPRIMTKN